jgi:hypothetical protein
MRQDDADPRLPAADIMLARSTPRSLGGRFWAVFRWIIPLGTLAVLAFILRAKLSPEDLTQALANSAPEWLLVGLGFYALTNVLRAGRTACLLRWPRTRIASLVPAMFTVSMLNNVMPMRTGELSFPYLLHELGVQWSRSLAVLLVVRLFDLLAVCLLFMLAALTQLSSLSGSARAVLVAAVGISIGLSIALASLSVLGQRVLDFLSARLSANSRLAAFWGSRVCPPAEKAISALETIRSGPVYSTTLLYSLFIWLATYGWFAAFLRGIGTPQGFGEVALGASFAVIAKSLPLSSFGGFGAHEAGWAFGFALLGQQVDMAIVSGLAVNVLTLVSSLLCGTASLAWLAVRSGRSLLSYRPWRAEGTVPTPAPASLPMQGTKDGMPAPHKTRGRVPGALSAILILFLVLGTVYSVMVPLFETPDEVWHYLYVKYIADGHGLPVYSEGITFPMRQEASQPPLFYLLNGLATAWIDTSDANQVIQYNPHAAIGAPAAWGNRNVISHLNSEGFPFHGTSLAAHLVRLLSVLMGVATVLCTYAIVARLFPRQGWLAVAAAALNAFTPQFLFISASVNNDVLATLLAAVCLLLVVGIVQDGPSMGMSLALGIVIGLAGLTKLNALVLIPLTGLVLLLAAWRRGNWHSAAIGGFAAVAAAAVAGGWWYLRNWLLYHDPSGLKLMFAVLPARTQRPTFPELLHLLDGALKSFWGVYGWFNIAMEGWVYAVFQVGMVLALAGLLGRACLCVARRRWAELLRLGLLALWSIAFVGALAGWTQARYPQGRLLFPAMPAISTLLILGLAQWFPARFRRWSIASMLTILLGFAVVVPFRYIAPAYAQAAPLTAGERTAISNPLPLDIGDGIRLLGYDLSDKTIKPGSELRVTLYWECRAAMDRDYSVFVHLVDARGVIIAQRDSYPGAGNDPTRNWTIGKTMRDVYPLDVPATLLAQGPCRLHIGLYDYQSGQRLIVHGYEGEQADVAVLPTELTLEVRPPDTVQEVQFQFGDSIALVGYAVEPIATVPGGTLHVTLRWQALQTLHANYTVFVHLMRTGAQIWAQDDHVPSAGQAPTSTWAVGQVVTDAFDLRVSPDAPTDSYQLIVGLYDSATVKRLKLSTGLDYIVLGQIDVGGR